MTPRPRHANTTIEKPQKEEDYVARGDILLLGAPRTPYRVVKAESNSSICRIISIGAGNWKDEKTFDYKKGFTPSDLEEELGIDINQHILGTEAEIIIKEVDIK